MDIADESPVYLWETQVFQKKKKREAKILDGKHYMDIFEADESPRSPLGKNK